MVISKKDTPKIAQHELQTSKQSKFKKLNVYFNTGQKMKYRNLKTFWGNERRFSNTK